MGEEKIYSVSEITHTIKKTLEESYTDIWVEGEISNYTCAASGHRYFSIKDGNAQLSVVCFKSAAERIAFTIENGIRVVIFGRISVYDKRGTYQLYAQRMEPKGIGALQLAFEQLKKKLLKEGLFDEEHKKRFEAQYLQPASQAIYRQRKSKVELPFGYIKRNLNVDSFLLRGLEGVRAEFSLLSTCFNLSRMINLMGVPKLIQAMAV